MYLFISLLIMGGPCHSSMPLGVGVLPRNLAFSCGCHQTYMVDEGMSVSPRFFGVFPA